MLQKRRVIVGGTPKSKNFGIIVEQKEQKEKSSKEALSSNSALLEHADHLFREDVKGR